MLLFCFVLSFCALALLEILQQNMYKHKTTLITYFWSFIQNPYNSK